MRILTRHYFNSGCFYLWNEDDNGDDDDNNDVDDDNDSGDDDDDDDDDDRFPNFCSLWVFELNTSRWALSTCLKNNLFGQTW